MECMERIGVPDEREPLSSLTLQARTCVGQPAYDWPGSSFSRFITTLCGITCVRMPMSAP